MKWTRDRPTEPGWYWSAHDPADDAAPVAVARIDGTLYVNDCGWVELSLCSFPLWSDRPIPEPGTAHMAPLGPAAGDEQL